MRNKKGFTLVELIVVIAIIGVLAAILVPSMLGFVRDARITSANSNAHSAYTGMQACLTKYATSKSTTALKGATYTVIEGSVNNAAISADTPEGLKALGEYLGADTFKGVARSKLDDSGSAIVFTVWTADKANTSLAVTQLTADAQECLAKAGDIIGCHPVKSKS